MNLSSELAKINQQILSKGIRLRIEQRGDLLNLRGPLPCSKQKGITRMQRISLHLAADNEGFKEAQTTLELIILQLKYFASLRNPNLTIIISKKLRLFINIFFLIS